MAWMHIKWSNIIPVGQNIWFWNKMNDFPIFWRSSHFQRVEITWRGIERDEILVRKCAQTLKQQIEHRLCCIVKALRSIELDFDSYFSEKNIEISATQWPKFFSKIFFQDFKTCAKLSKTIFYPIEGAYPSSAFGTATPTYDLNRVGLTWLL